MMLINLFHGFCMALADSVPGYPAAQSRLSLVSTINS